MRQVSITHPILQKKEETDYLMFIEHHKFPYSLRYLLMKKVYTPDKLTLELEQPRGTFIFYGYAELQSLGTGRGLGYVV